MQVRSTAVHKKREYQPIHVRMQVKSRGDQLIVRVSPMPKKQHHKQLFADFLASHNTLYQFTGCACVKLRGPIPQLCLHSTIGGSDPAIAGSDPSRKGDSARGIRPRNWLDPPFVYTCGFADFDPPCRLRSPSNPPFRL